MVYIRNIFITTCIILLVSAELFDCKTIEVENLGTLVGSTAKSFFKGETIYQFLGIRYAKPPSGNLRFKVKTSF